MKPIRLSKHALGYRESRGFSLEEVLETIRNEPWEQAERGRSRFQCQKEFKFEGIWNGKPFSIKRVRPIFIEEDFEIVVVTVYTYYY
jgi:hypothetical protein